MPAPAELAFDEALHPRDEQGRFAETEGISPYAEPKDLHLNKNLTVRADQARDYLLQRYGAQLERASHAGYDSEEHRKELAEAKGLTVDGLERLTRVLDRAYEDAPLEMSKVARLEVRDLEPNVIGQTSQWSREDGTSVLRLDSDMVNGELPITVPEEPSSTWESTWHPWEAFDRDIPDQDAIALQTVNHELGHVMWFAAAERDRGVPYSEWVLKNSREEEELHDPATGRLMTDRDLFTSPAREWLADVWNAGMHGPIAEATGTWGTSQYARTTASEGFAEAYSVHLADPTRDFPQLDYILAVKNTVENGVPLPREKDGRAMVVPWDDERWGVPENRRWKTAEPEPGDAYVASGFDEAKHPRDERGRFAETEGDHGWFDEPLVHYTTAEGVAGITKDGAIRAGDGVLGPGVYLTSAKSGHDWEAMFQYETDDTNFDPVAVTLRDNVKVIDLNNVWWHGTEEDVKAWGLFNHEVGGPHYVHQDVAQAKARAEGYGAMADGDPNTTGFAQLVVFDPKDVIVTPLTAGAQPGHPFQGNQWTGAGEDLPKADYRFLLGVSDKNPGEISKAERARMGRILDKHGEPHPGKLYRGLAPNYDNEKEWNIRQIETFDPHNVTASGFDESQHPRDERGRFAETEGTSDLVDLRPDQPGLTLRAFHTAPKQHADNIREHGWDVYRGVHQAFGQGVYANLDTPAGHAGQARMTEIDDMYGHLQSLEGDKSIVQLELEVTTEKPFTMSGEEYDRALERVDAALNGDWTSTIDPVNPADSDWDQHPDNYGPMYDFAPVLAVAGITGPEAAKEYWRVENEGVENYDRYENEVPRPDDYRDNFDLYAEWHARVTPDAPMEESFGSVSYDSQATRNLLLEAGYDAIIFRDENLNTLGDQIVVLKPENIKIISETEVKQKEYTWKQPMDPSLKQPDWAPDPWAETASAAPAVQLIGLEALRRAALRASGFDESLHPRDSAGRFNWLRARPLLLIAGAQPGHPFQGNQWTDRFTDDAAQDIEARLKHVRDRLPPESPADREAHAALQRATLSVRTSRANAMSLLTGGRLKTAYDLNQRERAEKGLDARYMENRLRVEERKFGIDRDAGSFGRPVYGYVESAPGAAQGTSSYGEAIVVLKDDAKTRTTVTAGDSIMFDGTPVLMTEQRGAAAAGLASADDRYSYAEAQIHGGVAFDDVRAIILPEGSKPPTERQLAGAAKRGIEVHVGDAIVAGAQPGHPFYGNQWTDALDRLDALDRAVAEHEYLPSQLMSASAGLRKGAQENRDSVRQFLNGVKPIASASKGAFTVHIMPPLPNQEWGKGLMIAEKKGEAPAAIQRWMGGAELNWGVSQAEFERLPLAEQAAYEARQQLVYLPKSWKDYVARTYDLDRALVATGFDEALHPRDEAGRFTDGGDSSLPEKFTKVTNQMMLENVLDDQFGPGFTVHPASGSVPGFNIVTPSGGFVVAHVGDNLPDMLNRVATTDETFAMQREHLHEVGGDWRENVSNFERELYDANPEYAVAINQFSNNSPNTLEAVELRAALVDIAGADRESESVQDGDEDMHSGVEEHVVGAEDDGAYNGGIPYSITPGDGLLNAAEVIHRRYEFDDPALDETVTLYRGAGNAEGTPGQEVDLEVNILSSWTATESVASNFGTVVSAEVPLRQIVGEGAIGEDEVYVYAPEQELKGKVVR